MFDFDEACYQLEDFFDSVAVDGCEADELLAGIDGVLLACGCTEDSDPDEIVECISTAAHNSCIDPFVVRDALGIS